MLLKMTDEEALMIDQHLKIATQNLEKQLDQLKMVEKLHKEVLAIRASLSPTSAKSDGSFEISEETRNYLMKFIKTLPLERVESLYLKIKQ